MQYVPELFWHKVKRRLVTNPFSCHQHIFVICMFITSCLFESLVNNKTFPSNSCKPDLQLYFIFFRNLAINGCVSQFLLGSNRCY